MAIGHQDNSLINALSFRDILLMLDNKDFVNAQSKETLLPIFLQVKEHVVFQRRDLVQW